MEFKNYNNNKRNSAVTVDFANFYCCIACSITFSVNIDPNEYIFCPNCSSDKTEHIGTGYTSMMEKN